LVALGAVAVGGAVAASSSSGDDDDATDGVTGLGGTGGDCSDYAGIYNGAYDETYCDESFETASLSLDLKADCRFSSSDPSFAQGTLTVTGNDFTTQGEDELCGTMNVVGSFQDTSGGMAMIGNYSYSLGGGGSFNLLRTE
jgi:hypothetical protein